ncbi:DinB family protein [Soonwooa sp.]|uniref:DinB family protein n=1 Tax=Soonwooa sp. TaxID=1938592 RepID=UPI0026022000|nr:DinB family protein [Soonwooa sp.]
MKFNSEDLLSQLITQTKKNIAFVESLQSLSDEQLNKRISENSWSILEVVQHLNLYANFYHQEIETKMQQSNLLASENFSSGILGNYFAKSMLPKDKLNKMKTPKAMNPIFTNLDRNILTVFSQHQNQLLKLLETAKTKDLSKIKTNISLTPIIKIRLGDTFRFVVNHNLRHIKQIERILNSKKMQ